MKANVLDHTKRHHRFFEELTRIPHGSYHEAAYGDYLEQFAKDRGYSWKRDSIGNVVIYRPASDGYEDHPSVAVQAHMDMVWAKTEDAAVDLEKDPLDLYIEDGFLKARGTTLGADDGTGVAYILAILDDTSLKLPAIEAVFTVQEEVGLGGAMAMDPAWIRSKRFISLDCGGGDSIYISSLAGYRGTAKKAFSMEPAAGNGYQITVSGLKGGYADGYRREQSNANKLAARLAYALSQGCGIRLSDISGGDEENKIARQCQITLTTEASEMELRKAFEAAAADIQKECGAAEPELSMVLEPKAVTEQMTKVCSKEILSYLFLFPNGFRHKDIRFPEITSESINWSVSRCENGCFTMIYNLRGSSDSRIRNMQNEIGLLSEIHQVELQCENAFPAWEFHDSELLHTLQRVFREVRGKELGLIPVQGGLECGVFAGRYPDMDILAMGPSGYNVHTPEEKLDLQSFDVIYEVFCRFLENL